VTAPDLPGCTSGRDTTDVARRGSHPALGRSADGQELPAPRSAETLGADPEVAQAIAEGSALDAR
jgi:hypothetical protein